MFSVFAPSGTRIASILVSRHQLEVAGNARPETKNSESHDMLRHLRLPSIIAAAAIAACGVGIAADQAEVPAGTTLKIRVAIFDADGEELVPAGSLLHGKILTLQEDPPRAQLEFSEIEIRGETKGIDASLIEFAPAKQSEMKDEGKKIGGGAAAGAIVGGLVGGDVGGAAVGAVAGAAAGTGVALATKDSHVFVPAGSIFQLELLQSVPV